MAKSPLDIATIGVGLGEREIQVDPVNERPGSGLLRQRLKCGEARIVQGPARDIAPLVVMARLVGSQFDSPRLGAKRLLVPSHFGEPRRQSSMRVGQLRVQSDRLSRVLQRLVVAIEIQERPGKQGICIRRMWLLLERLA